MLDKLTRWSSGLLILSGALVAGAIPFHPDMELPGFALSRAWAPVHVLLGLAALLTAGGFGLVYRAIGGRITPIGHSAFVLAIVGNVMVAGISLFVEATIIPVLAGDPAYERLLAVNGPLLGGAYGSLSWLSYAIMSIGTLILAGYLVAVKVMTVPNGVLFIATPFAGFVPPFPTLLGIICGVVLGAAMIWFGISVLKGAAHKAISEELLAYDECFSQAASGHA